MGFQGQLASVNIADIFQTLQMNRQTGTLSVTGPEGPVHIWFDQGQIGMASAPLIDGTPFLIHALIRKGLLRPELGSELTTRARTTGQPLRALVAAVMVIDPASLDETCAWCIEEQVCPIFEWADGDFTFTDGDPITALLGLGGVAMGEGGVVQTTNLLLEATRRKDEWRRIRDVISDPHTLFVVDDDGHANLRQVQTDPEMLKVLRLLDGRHTPDAVAAEMGATRFDTWAIIAQMVVAQVARPCSPEDILADAQALREAGELAQARDLLEIMVRYSRVPEVIRPLAEITAELKEGPRAVELYLELVQSDQDRGELDRALADLDIVIGLSPDDPELHFERAQVRAELGQSEAAASGYVQAAQSFLGTRDVAKAIDACHRAKNILPRAPEPHRWLAKAYLMEGQTDNATVEYKSLWHALLTTARPCAALDQLRQILDNDCKYGAIKEQVLSHAGNSEAVKTSKATRLLVYAAMVVLAVVAGLASWEYYRRVVVANQGQGQVNELERTLSTRKDAAEHPQIIEELSELRARFGSNRDLAVRIDTMLAGVKQDFQDRALGLIARGDALLTGGDFVGAEQVFNTLRRDYRDTQAAASADSRLELVRQRRTEVAVDAPVAEAQRRWTAWDWDGALSGLDAVLARQDLPTELRARLTTLQVEWLAANRSAQRLLERAQRLEAGGNAREALGAYRRAAAGEGDQAAGAARDRARSLERDLVAAVGRQMQDAAIKGDDARAFTLVDDLKRMAKEAESEAVRTYVAGLDLIYTLTIDHPGTKVVIRRSGGTPTPDQGAQAPKGQQGSWALRLTYKADETLTVSAQRTGFSPLSITVSAAARRVQGPLTLVRGPKWKADLAAGASAPPAISGKFVLVPTGRGTLEIIDPVLGANQPVRFPDTVAEFRAAPLIQQERAFVVLDDQIHGIDINARTRLWSWPGSGPSGRNLTGALCVYEHDLIPGVWMCYAGTAKDGLLTLAISGNGRATMYPRIDLDNDLTGIPVSIRDATNRSVLLVPAGNQLVAFDTTVATERSPAAKLYTVRTRGDLTGRPVQATVAGRPAVLVSDSSGLVVGIDPTVGIPDTRRTLGSWPVEGAAPSSPVVDGTQAYVATLAGHVTAIDLAHPGQLRWRFPAGTAQGLGAIPGDPVAGVRGVYVATANGLLICLDRGTGKERWRCDLGQSAVGGLNAKDDRVFVPLRNGQLWCFEEGDE